ncbi:MAG: ABC transporter ATP-binding protein [Symploca sp. SIO2E6]|nr:ABC transporter ATP-binding protein [Symploca sp. SIO2E6]
MASVEFAHVFKVYPNGYSAIKDLCLEIKDGEFLVFVGPSGCGKSTAMRMLAGLEEISAGKLIIGGEVVNNKTPQQRNVAMVFQNYALYPHMTVKQNLEFPLRMMKIPVNERQERIFNAAQKLQLDELLDRKPKALSGGQRQRVAMGRAIVRDPSVFLMDEPLSNLDAKMRVEIRTEISELQREMQKTMVYVTHDQVEAMTMGDRVAVMQAGQLQQTAPPQELYDHPANIFVASFIGSPAMNIFKSQLHKTESGTFTIDMGNQHLALDQELLDKFPQLPKYLKRPILAGFRPEAFYLPDANISSDYCLQVEVESMEALGHEMIVYFDAPVDKIEVEESHEEPAVDTAKKTKGASILIARVPSSPDVYTGAKLNLAVDTSKLYLFDKDGKAIGY